MKKISIVIPVYNGENEVGKSIKSIMQQTYSNLEIIVVDDGSNDNSLQVCKSLAETDNRIVVIHQENAGVSAARNGGLSVASGDYVGFVDSDDWIEPEMFEQLIAEAEKSHADVVMCDATTVYEDQSTETDTITQLFGNRVLGEADFVPSLLLEMAGAVWRCIYSKHIFSTELPDACGIRFPLGVKFSEDRIFNLYAFGYANKVSYLKESYYNRFMNKKSAVHRFHSDYFEAYKRAAVEIDKAIKNAWGDDLLYKKAFMSQLIIGAFAAINNYYYKTSPLSFSERMTAVEKICNDKQLIEAIRDSGYGGMRSHWILKKKKLLLMGYAKLANLKHRR